jgi:hypothetical protein
MLTMGDDYPIHQTPEPIAFAGSDRNFYDRYFFNGYSADGEMFFATALGVYPHLNIMDAAFGVRFGDVQHNLHASRHMHMERMDTQVGPIRIEVVEPLKRLRIIVDNNEHGIGADLLFEGRHDVIEEPRSIRRNGPRVLMDYTRLTQVGHYTGWVEAGGTRIDAATSPLAGTRDRSWGVRTIGLRDPQVMVPTPEPQFHWYWVPAHLDDRVIHFFINHDGNGETWHGDMVMVRDGGSTEHFAAASIEVTPHPGTRWPARGVITFVDRDGRPYRIEVEAARRFYLSGLGYMNPEWGHGLNKGPLAIGYDEIHPGDMAEYGLINAHAEAFARIKLIEPDGSVVHGIGTFESLSMGRYAPWGVTGLVETP